MVCQINNKIAVISNLTNFHRRITLQNRILNKKISESSKLTLNRSNITLKIIIISMKKIAVLLLLCFFIQSTIIQFPPYTNQVDPPQIDPPPNNSQNDQPQNTPTQQDPFQGDPTQNDQDNQTPQEGNPDQNNAPQNGDNPTQDYPADQTPQQNPEQILQRGVKPGIVIDLTSFDCPTNYDFSLIAQQFEQFKLKYGRRYNLFESLYRLLIFQQNVQKINAHNSNPRKTYKQDINQFTDRTEAEYLSTLMMGLGSRPPITGQIVTADPDFRIEDVKPIDYRKLNALNSVRNQGQVLTCWAFSVITAIESNNYLKKKALPILSEQHLVDCCPLADYECHGMNGTWPGAGLRYSGDKGNAYRQSYPYVEALQKCKTTVFTKKYLQQKTPYLQMKGLKDTLFHLTKKGPLSVTIDATRIGCYQSGIFNDCPTTNLVYNHAMVVVGIEAGNVWIVRNSWGASWGEKGYIRFAAGNICGMTDWVLLPNIA